MLSRIYWFEASRNHWKSRGHSAPRDLVAGEFVNSKLIRMALIC
jgi:hypothetical protein